jgi:hypothetical protein
MMQIKNPNDAYTIRRTTLLERLKANREKHRATFEQAIVGFRKMAIAELDRSIADAKAGKKISLYVRLTEPQDHTAEYDAVIDLFELVEDEFLEISYGDFLRFVRDQWDWTGQFTETANLYNSQK